MKTRVLLLIMLGLLITVQVIVFNHYVNDVNKNKECSKQLQLKDSIIKHQLEQIKTLDTIISVAHNSQVLFENIVGVKEPDGIITYKEKCLVTADRIHKLNRYKLN